MKSIWYGETRLLCSGVILSALKVKITSWSLYSIKSWAIYQEKGSTLDQK